MSIVAVVMILLIANCYFTWQIAIAPRQLKQFGDLYMITNQELSKKLDEINALCPVFIQSSLMQYFLSY